MAAFPPGSAQYTYAEIVGSAPAGGFHTALITKVGDQLNFKLTDSFGITRANHTVPSLASAAPWFDASNSRLAPSGPRAI